MFQHGAVLAWCCVPRRYQHQPGGAI